MSRTVRVLKRLNSYFALNWARVPFQPILYTFLLLGALLIVLFDIDYPAFVHNSRLFIQWIALSVLMPPLALLSWILIKFHPGRPRYLGFWLRAAADVGQIASVSAFIAVVSQQIDPIASEIYAAQIFSAVWWFLLVLVIRDIWKIVLTERVATAIEQRKDDEADGDQ